MTSHRPVGTAHHLDFGGHVEQANQMRQVLFLTAWYPADDADIQGTFVREHAKAAARVARLRIIHLDRHRATLPAWPSWVDSVDHEVDGGVAVRRLRPGVRGPAVVENMVVLLLLGIALVQLRRDGFRPSILHAHVHEAAFFGAVAARLLRIPLVMTEHSSVFGRGDLGFLSALKARWTARVASTLMPVSEDLACTMRACGLHGAYVVVPNTVDPAVFHCGAPREWSRQVLFVGRLSSEKGVTDILEAIVPLAGVNLVIAGDGPLRGELERRIHVQDLTARVRLCGAVPKQAVADLMRTSDVLAVPSSRENLPCVIVEALVTGLPVVASRVGGIPEVVDGSCGALVEPGDVPALRAAIASLLETPLDRRAIAERSLSRYGLDAISARLDAVYAGAAA